MPRKFIKSLRFAVWLVLPFVFTSFISPYEKNSNVALVEGRYHLKTSDNEPMLLEGSIYFSTSITASSKGKPYSVIKLDLENSRNSIVHSMGFIISKQNRNKEIGQGKYKVPVKIDGFITNFEGVFGFANIKERGELPFFAENGNIEISYIGPKLLVGNLKIKLKNSEGKLLNIRGDFSAIRKKIE